MQSLEFYQNHLDKVSRSFAFCIARLQLPLRQWVSLSYLLCRVLDTVEDVLWSDAQDKQQSFRSFEDFLRNLPTEEKVQDWNKKIPHTMKAEEKALLQDFYLLLQDFHALPYEVREKLGRSILNMSRGMSYFSQKNVNGELHLQDLREVNQYCFFVAGLVGELLTDLLHAYTPQLGRQLSESLYLKAHHFGLFLQKINLLKDQTEDEKEGRYLVPNRQELFSSLCKDAQGAVDYIVSIPVAQKEYRLFCAWSLFIGLASLPWIQRSRFLGVLGKIPRVLTQKLMASVELMIDDNQALLRLFQEMLPHFPKAPREVSSELRADWFTSVYQGELSLAHRQELGIA